MGEKIGGDMDDWILGTLDIPSVTAELGFEDSYVAQWTIKSKAEALKICEDNEQWLEHTFSKLGAEIVTNPVYVEQEKEGQVVVHLNVTNEGMSDSDRGYEVSLKGFGSLQPSN
mmetsp:Transcript_31175/g.47705  ORF Transcript_31175/g.47705 Transcript_31175/m.47705 type:complete len:114 (+) Transcript_31175:1561-1902(+)